MEKYELDLVLERNFGAVLNKALPPIESDSLIAVADRDLKHKKQVKFNEEIEVQWPEAAERLRREAADFIARRKAEREARLLALVYRDEGRDRGKSDEDPKHPHFPFPPQFKPIDFDHLDPYKLYQAAEYLKEEQRKMAEPFLTHAKKIHSFGKRAEAEYKREEERLHAIPSPKVPKLKTNQAIATIYTIPSYKPASRRKGSAASKSSRTTVVMAQMNNPGGKVKSQPGYYPKIVTKVSRRPRASTENLALRNVQIWLKSNFQIKPVPLILHSPKMLMAAPVPSAASNLPRTQSSSYSIKPPQSPAEAKELHVLNGLVISRNVFNDTVGNSFAQDYDNTIFKDSVDYKQNWIPHRFRCTVDMGKFQDHEISFFFKRPFLTVKAERPRSLKRLGEKAEETIEVPDWLQLDTLKIFRLGDGKIIIEEGGRRKAQAEPKADQELLSAIKKYFPVEV